MFVGIAGALLVFTGIWHATEWLMDGRRNDTVLLIPIGIIYALLGGLLVMGTGGMITQIVALIIVATGGTVAFLRRDQFDIRKWVMSAFIGIDVVIVVALVIGLLL